MRELLGLSLTADTVAWTLVDLKDGTILAEDVVEVDSAENVANTAAHSVEAFVSKAERTIDAIRIAWSKGTAGSGVQLTSKLRSLGFSDTDLVTEDEARQSRNRTARYIDPPLELAYGAARTVTAGAHNRPLRRVGVPRRRVLLTVASSIVVMAMGTAAAAFFLVNRTPSPAADYASTPLTSAPAPDDSPWFAVPAAVLPPPPAPEPAAAPPVELALPPLGVPVVDVPAATPPVEIALPPVEVAAPPVTEEPEVESAPETVDFTDTAPTPVQAVAMTGQPHLAAEAPAAGSMTTAGSTSSPEAASAPGPAPTTMTARQPHLTPEAPSAGPETAPLPYIATAPGPTPTITMAGQPHLIPQALTAPLRPGPVPPMPVVGVPAPPLAAPPPPPNPLGLLAALP